VIENARPAFFDRGVFPVVSTQAAVMDRQLFAEDPLLRFVEKAAGQDTLFGWELLLSAGSAAFTVDAHIVYYAGRTTSVTNTIDRTYFEKSLILETAQAQRLGRLDLLDQFREGHLRQFVDGWYIPKLDRVAPVDRDYCRSIVEQICALYGVDLKSREKEKA